MNIFQEAKPEMAYLKLGIYGEAGSGKSFTASKVAIGLCKLIDSKKPVAFADTETGSDFVRHLFLKEKIRLFVTKTRTFAKLIEDKDKDGKILPGILDEAESECSVLIIDSITHYWNELIDAYLKKMNKTRLTLRDWQPLKATWREFTTRFINSKLHIVLCGRSADKWEEVEDPEDGSKELRKTGTKMRTETEMAYEPSLLVEMEAVQLSARTGGAYVHRAYVKKDRFDIINGQVYDDPTFESFLPHIEKLNLGGEHKAIEPGRSSVDLFNNENIGEKRMLNRDILLEKIGNEIKLLYPGQKEEEKTARLMFMKEIFGTHSWTEISSKRTNEELRAGLEAIEARTKKQECPFKEPESKKGKKEKKS